MDASFTNPELHSELQRLQARVAELESAAVRHAQAADALRDSEQLYRRLVETSPDSIVLTDVSGLILMANPQSAKLHGYAQPGDLVGMNILDIVPEEDRPQAAADIERITETGELRDRQHVLLREDGSSFIGEVTGALIRDAAGEPKYILYHGRDITTRMRLHREMVESQKLESIGRLAGGIAHDFNNLLAVILGNASLQLRNRDLPAKTIECLKDVVEAAERASSLTTQLLAYARGGLRRPVPSDLNKLVQSACDIVRPTLRRQVELELQLAEKLPTLSVDRAQIQQVIINLCMNAIQASSAPGTVEIRTAGEVLDETAATRLELSPGAYARVEVCDQGAGINPAILDRVFEPFFTTRPDSRGMGLPASLGIVRNHGGRLLIESEPGRGTRATVWLPALARDDENRPSEARIPVANVPHGSETILVIEPDPAVGHTTEQMLASLGYCVTTRNDVVQALAFIKTNCEDIDLIIVNANLPTRATPQVVRLALEDCVRLPVLLSSGDEQTAEAAEMVKAGAAAFIQKPFSIMTLAQAVRSVLDDPSRPKRPEPGES